ncbi:MAG: glycosyltransferase family 4 protein, partial [Dehalococcoidia bacterium]|nr:glycosyltransferase family 4 protein [Dehalococcoidia bacterium]
EVKRRIAALGISDSVVLHGYVPEREKVELLSNCAVYVSNSRFEGFGIPVVEAMATGTVPVVSNIGGHEFILQGQDAGYLVDSVEEMAVKIADLLTHEARRSELARNGRKLVEEKWTWVKVSEKYRKLVGVA